MSDNFYEDDGYEIEEYRELYDLLTGEVEIKGRMYNLREEMELFFGEGNKQAGKRARVILLMLRKSATKARSSIQEFKRDMLE